MNTATQIVEVVRRRQPDVWLIDGHFAGGDGLVVLVATASPRTGLLVLSGDRDADMVRRAREFDAAGFVSKASGVAALIAAIRKVVDGNIVVDVSRPRRRDCRGTDETRRLADYLTLRERECLVPLAEGLGTEGIGSLLGILSATVGTHIRATLDKLGMHSRLEATASTFRHALFVEDPPYPATVSAP